MKPINRKLWMLMAMLWAFISASAYDFEVDGIYYNILSLEDLTCEVTYNADNRNTTYVPFYRYRGDSDNTISLDKTYPSYTGDVTIPPTVSYKGRVLSVIGIGEYAFLNCRELTSLTLPSSISQIEEVEVHSYYDCYAGPFDYCKIETFTAGNAYTLDMFNHSYAGSYGYKTKDNLKNLILSDDFSGIIDVNFSEYEKLVYIQSNTTEIPSFSDSPHFSNNQYLNILVSVPTSSLELYKSSKPWSGFWDIIGSDIEAIAPDILKPYDFEVDGIYYNILSLEDLTCEVTYNADNRNTTYVSFYRYRGDSDNTISLDKTYPSYTGDVTIPPTVSYKGRVLSVIGIGEYAFLNCRELTSLTLPSSISQIEEVELHSYYNCYAGPFDYCKIETFTAGNAYTLDMFNHSYAGSYGYKTKDNLKNLILSDDFSGIIDVNFSKYSQLGTIRSNVAEVPAFSEEPHFTNEQFLNLEVLVPEDALPAYQSANIWKDFWELKAMKSVKSITLNESTLNLEPNQTSQLLATVLPEDAYDTSVIWSTSNPEIATVDENGLVTAVSKGNAVIAASSTDGSDVSAECMVHVDLLVKEITLSEPEIGLEPGKTKQLEVTISPEGAFVKDVVWFSDNEDVATVDEQGLVTAHNVGTASISVTTTDGSDLSAICKVIVAELVKSIDVTPENATLNEGETQQLLAVVLPETATYKDVVWSSDNTDIANVDESGLVTAISAGTTLIKATASDGSGVFGQCEITVIAKTIENNGIYYQRNSPTSLKILANPENPYSGDFFVPKSALFDGSELPVTEIGENAFEDCTELTSIVIPSTVSKIAASSFKGCDKLGFVKICDGSSIEANLDAIFPDSPLKELYVGSNGITYDSESRLLKVIKSMTLGGSVTILPPKAAFDTLNSFIVEEGDNPIVEPEDYCTSTTKLINQQTIKDPYTYIYYRFFYLVTYTHLSPILNALQKSTLNYLHIGREVQKAEVDTSLTQEFIPTTAGSRYQEYGYKDEVNYQYEENIVKSDYNRHPVESISINESAIELNIGETVKLEAICMPVDASFTEVDWTSSDESLAVVDIFGNVTRLACGEVEITATTTDGSYLSATCRILNPGTGIEEVVGHDESTVHIVYNLQGILILKTDDIRAIKQLPAGLYIVDGKKTLVR